MRSYTIIIYKSRILRKQKREREAKDSREKSTRAERTRKESLQRYEQIWLVISMCLMDLSSRRKGIELVFNYSFLRINISGGLGYILSPIFV